MQLHAGFFDVVNLYTVVGGLTMVMLCLLHGLMFTTLRTLGIFKSGRAAWHGGF